MPASIEQLTRVWVLKDLDVSSLKFLQPHTHIQNYFKDEIVACEGDRLPESLHALIDGGLQIKKNAANGKETLIRIISPGEIFAAPAIFGNGIAPATVICEVESQVLTIARKALLDTIRHTPEVAFRILEVFDRRLQQLHGTVHGLISERAIVRLVRLIRYYADRYGTVAINGKQQLKFKLPHQKVARSIGITYEECVRLFKKIDAIVEYKRGGSIVIKNRDALEKLVE
ncbi:Crp/Fnr family transcriptional regulator [Oscillatoriales cyanobacterium LEGE 11467]|uniref:Crp/Fnr family transcriptional regulator n=1 Tax=Zarconia navalis LEGE 11467 TaxID=1828826 RepID=A0A928Z6K8_9CYAN|nr:Crp/Fnr family transcriptional regulator [Zarconia navalis]MBE9040477.1 Crp/Fnr family transcriptional regulator [Zarconia navalis LEGE 11467]